MTHLEELINDIQEMDYQTWLRLKYGDSPVIDFIIASLMMALFVLALVLGAF